MNSFYTTEELSKIGLSKIGKDVLISKYCSIYSPEDISIGNNVRIDDFVILSGKIKIGNNVHISAFCALYGKYGIEIGNYCGCSPRTIIFSATDDFSGDHLIGPVVPSEFIKLTAGKVVLQDYVQLGANTVVMPNLTIEEGAVTGAFSYVKKSLKCWTINVGIPANTIRERSRKLLNFVNELEDNSNNG